jgi:hypothetical protein
MNSLNYLIRFPSSSHDFDEVACQTEPNPVKCDVVCQTEPNPVKCDVVCQTEPNPVECDMVVVRHGKPTVWLCPFGCGFTCSIKCQNVTRHNKVHYIGCASRPDDWKEPDNMCKAPGYRLYPDEVESVQHELDTLLEGMHRRRIDWGERRGVHPRPAQPRKVKNEVNVAIPDLGLFSDLSASQEDVLLNVKVKRLLTKRFVCPHLCGFHSHCNATGTKKRHLATCAKKNRVKVEVPTKSIREYGYYVEADEVDAFLVDAQARLIDGRELPKVYFGVGVSGDGVGAFSMKKNN